jgi:hypothetical protein
MMVGMNQGDLVWAGEWSREARARGVAGKIGWVRSVTPLSQLPGSPSVVTVVFESCTCNFFHHELTLDTISRRDT